MNNRFKICLGFIFLSVLLVFENKYVSAQSDDKVRAMWVFNIAEYVSWQGEDKFDKFTIGVYSVTKGMVTELKELGNSKKIKNKSVEILYFNNIKSITKTHLVFVGNEMNSDVEELYKKLKSSNTLIITDRYTEPKFIMINLLSLHEGKKRYEFNKPNLLEEKLSLSKEILVHGGSEIDLRGIYSQTEKELDEQRAKLELQREEIKKQEDLLKVQKEELAKQKDENARQREQINKQKAEIQEQEKKIAAQKDELNKLFQDLDQQQEKLKLNLEILTKQEEKINEKQSEVQQKEDLIKEKAKIIEDADEKIMQQKTTLKQYSKTVREQKQMLYISLLFIFLFICLVFFIYRSFLIKRRANKLLEEKNIAINKQKEELYTQAKQLELLNTELEKLSIVASKTHNAVIIMDPQGNIEWVNAGFTKMYGYTLQLWFNERDENLLKSSAHKEIDRITNTCFNKKETVIYESMNISRSGEKKWVQTTMTPILDDDKNILKLVAIDADISKLKEAEIEIRQKNEELHSQKEELEQQKEQIELQNKHIRASILYALTIQKAILPINTEIALYINSFIIYKPKDIVSGDFYWFTHIHDTQKLFFAMVDCTGHGVPGAFMSMIGNRLLNEIVIEREIHNPSAILEELDKDIKLALKQSDTANDDGMDVSICLLEKQDENQTKITCAAAKHPVICYHKKISHLETIKGSRRSIGGAKAKRNVVMFENTEFIVEKNDMLYLFTDGIIDQHAADRKRFGTPRFMELLEKIAPLELTKQKEGIELELHNYQSKEDQRDDITVWGIMI